SMRCAERSVSGNSIAIPDRPSRLTRRDAIRQEQPFPSTNRVPFQPTVGGHQSRNADGSETGQQSDGHYIPEGTPIEQTRPIHHVQTVIEPPIGTIAFVELDHLAEGRREIERSLIWVAVTYTEHGEDVCGFVPTQFERGSRLVV